MSDEVSDEDWVCDECGAESKVENAPCDCDDTCTQHAATIKLLRANADRLQAERNEACTERDGYRSALANLLAASKCVEGANSSLDFYRSEARELLRNPDSPPCGGCGMNVYCKPSCPVQVSPIADPTEGA